MTRILSAQTLHETMLTPRSSGWEKWFKVVAWGFSLSVVPGITWAFQVERQLTVLSQQMVYMVEQYQNERTANRLLVEKVDQLRQSVETLRVEMIQRMARVETKLEGK